MRDFKGNENYLETNILTTDPDEPGLRVRLRFEDNETMEGIVENGLDLIQASGFFLARRSRGQQQLDLRGFVGLVGFPSHRRQGLRIRIYRLVFLGGLIGPFWLFAISCSKAAHMEDLRVPETVPPAACVVVGFLGGHDARDDATKGVRQLALRLREPGHIYTETFSNQSRKLAEAYLFAILDRNGDGTIGIDERRTLVVYGQSYGGAAVVKFAWRLAHLQVPIHLTVQIDSVGTDDARIPPNVTFAANLYQKNGWIIAGENPIRPVDPSRTGILGNWLFDYDSPPGSEINIDDLSFWKKLMRVAHAKMDRDPRVWKLTEGVIREACRMGRLETRGFGLTEP